MIWKKYEIHTNTNDCDLVCAVLNDYGINDVQIDNNVQLTDDELNQMYADFVKELPEDDGSCTVSFYLDENGFIPEGTGTGDSPSAANEKPEYSGTFVDIAEVVRGLEEASEIFGIEHVVMETSSVNTQDWSNKWKENFRPFSVGNFIIKPTWEEIPDEMRDINKRGAGKVVINIDPGMAFGTGMHETTRLCLCALEKYIRPGMKVLDLGCGSGILGIAALKSGASYVTAIDIDEQAVKIAKENFELNFSGNDDYTDPGNIKTDYQVYAANILEKREKLFEKSAAADNPAFSEEILKAQDDGYDIVLANILADVIVPLSGFVSNFIKKDGIFIASGIIDTKLGEVEAAVNSNDSLALADIMQDGEWRAVTARRIKQMPEES